MNDCISSEIEKASEIVAFDENQVQGWQWITMFGVKIVP